MEAGQQRWYALGVGARAALQATLDTHSGQQGCYEEVGKGLKEIAQVLERTKLEGHEGRMYVCAEGGRQGSK